MTETRPDVADLIRDMREGLDGVTEGPWQVVETKHPWRLEARPQRGLPEKTGAHTERRIFTTWIHGQSKAPWSVVNQSSGITDEPKRAVQMVYIEERDAAHIARCSPDNIAALLDTITRLQSDLTAMTERAEKAEGKLDSYAQHSVDNSMRAFNWMAAHDALKAGIPYTYPTPADVPNAISRAETAEAEVTRLNALLKTATEHAARHPLEVYAESYAQMARNGDGRVDCRSVEVDIRQNMIPATRAMLASRPYTGDAK